MDRGPKDFRHNYIVNVLDGAFFGFGIGFASFTTIIPLFVSTMTNSAILIGLIPAIHVMGWQLPQLLTAKSISRLKRFKPYVIVATFQERLPFLLIGLIALFYPHLTPQVALILTFLSLIWQGLAGGFAANAWQNMISRVIPADYVATFYGVQSAAANLTASIGAILAGYLLQWLLPTWNFAACFLIGNGLMWISFACFAMTREPERVVEYHEHMDTPLFRTIVQVLKKDRNFFYFLLARMASQFAVMAFAFYMVYAVKHHGMTEVTAGIMTSVLFISQVVSNPILGRIADRWSRKRILELGAVATSISALLAWQAPGLSWFVVVFILAGIANTAFWTITMAMVLDFGTEIERPTYVGMANTLISPGAILAPLLGGWLADTAGYPVTFITAAFAGVITAGILIFLVREPRKGARGIIVKDAD
jgi:MFS family permease